MTHRHLCGAPSLKKGRATHFGLTAKRAGGAAAARLGAAAAGGRALVRQRPVVSQQLPPRAGGVGSGPGGCLTERTARGLMTGLSRFRSIHLWGLFFLGGGGGGGSPNKP